jgi:hypothetical protein
VRGTRRVGRAAGNGRSGRTTPVLTTYIEDLTVARQERPRGLTFPKTEIGLRSCQQVRLLQCCFPNSLVEISTGALLVPEQIGDRHSRIALRAQAAKPYASHKSTALLAVLLADRPGPTAVTLINSEGPPRPGTGQFDKGLSDIPAPAVSSGPARPRAELLAAGRGEGPLAGRAGYRDAIVTQRGPVRQTAGARTAGGRAGAAR